MLYLLQRDIIERERERWEDKEENETKDESKGGERDSERKKWEGRKKRKIIKRPDVEGRRYLSTYKEMLNFK